MRRLRPCISQTQRISPGLITSCIHWTHSFLSHTLVCSHLDFLSLLIPFIPMTWSANNYFLFHCQMLPVTQIPTISCLMTAYGPAPPQWLLPIDFKKGFIFLSAIAVLPASDFPPSEGYRCPSDFHHPSIPRENIQVYFKTFLLFIPFISFIHCCSLSTLTCLTLQLSAWQNLRESSVFHRVSPAAGPVWTRFLNWALFLARYLKGSTFNLCFRCFLYFFSISGHRFSSTTNSSTWQETCCWIYLSWLGFCSLIQAECLPYIPFNCKQSEVRIHQTARTCFLLVNFQRFKSGLIFRLIAWCQNLSMLHLPSKAFLLPGTWMLALSLSRHRKAADDKLQL